MPLDDDVKHELRFYMPDSQGQMSYRARDLDRALELFQEAPYDTRKPLMLILHGWFQWAEDEMPAFLLDALFKTKFYNVMNIMFLDSPQFMNNWNYYALANKVEGLGQTIGDILKEVIQQGRLKPEDINLLGMSLGAHLSGYIGRALDGKVYSIVGLDPAGPGFDSTSAFYLPHIQHVSRNDAQFVHIYHTNSAWLGTKERMGMADFQFNLGGIQPGCLTQTDIKCDHKRAFVLFSSVILGERDLIAVSCGSEELFKHCECKGNPTVVLQYPIDTRARGKYFLNTARKAPWGLGIKGITCARDLKSDVLVNQKEVGETLQKPGEEKPEEALVRSVIDFTKLAGKFINRFTAKKKERNEEVKKDDESRLKEKRKTVHQNDESSVEDESESVTQDDDSSVEEENENILQDDMSTSA